ncbi:DUF2254 domain-containing protein [Paracoccus sp. S1E-3]|uniref:DUF2254 domain-containing protein n=1 Tax=Paracoccus sp. S1E-3 TaxID=2756130 RepID=UPI0015EF2E8D|nr:DUF2254 domain-containing protein [Paracoccus sp. S1E-3]MBA4490942.1 DUF2254 domain-containing protein [Paracoccus sp. S1E-3]
MGWGQAGWWLRLRAELRRMGVRVALFSMAGIALAISARYVGPFVPDIPGIDLASGAVDSLLNIIASSMLAVTTFSMSIIVGAYGSVTANATPRATRLLEEDRTAQTAVAVFTGSFLFSIMGIIGLSAGLYPGNARVLLFIVTVIDILLITWALLRWVSHLNEFGRMRDIIARIELACRAPAQAFRDAPALGGVAADTVPDPAGPDLSAREAGHVRFVDLPRLQACASRGGVVVAVLRMPGKYVHRGEALLRLSAPVSDDIAAEMTGAFTLGASRSFDQDLRYGLTVLSEVGSKALSPGINDPGTAIEVLRAGTRIFEALHESTGTRAKPRFDRVIVPPLNVGALYQEFFSPIARDGAGMLEVQETLQDCLLALERIGDAPAARRESERAMTRALETLTEGWERDQLRAAQK